MQAEKKCVKERIGSSKKIITSGKSGLLNLEDGGSTSVFDRGVIPNFQSPELAEARTRQTAYAFTWLERNDIRTHWYKQRWSPSGRGLIVQEAQVGNKPLLSGKTNLDAIGLEMLFRVRASEKFCGRIDRDEVELPTKVWSKSSLPQPNDLLNRPYVEASTKWEAVDRYLTPKEAAEYIDLPIKTLQKLYLWVADIASHLNKLYSQAGATLVDGKVEVAICRETCDFVLIDGISLDELGVLYDDQDYGKKPLRDWYKSNHPDWCTSLQKAQKDHPDDQSKWPQYPPIDEELADDHIDRYEFMSLMLDKVVHS